MNEKVNLKLGDVQKTMLLPLWGRALETQKQDPLLVDKKAVEIIRQLDFDFSEYAKNLSEISKMGWTLRCVYVDQVVRDFIQKHPEGTIVNLGCGLDTNFERVDNGQIHWIDLDLPDVIEVRRRFINENARGRFISASLLEPSWHKLVEPVEAVLFMAAGVLYYFEEEQVKTFLKGLACAFPGSQIVFDVSSPAGIFMANRMVIKNSGLDEKSFLKWGLKNPALLETWDNRFKLLQTGFYFRQARASLGFKTRLMTGLSDLLKMQYMVHLAF